MRIIFRYPAQARDVIISNLLEKFKAWKSELGWPAMDQWRQLFDVSSKKEKNLFKAFTALAVLGAIILISAGYFAATVVQPAHAGSINIGIIGFPNFLNPVLQINDADKDLNTAIFSGLLKYDTNGQLINDLAQNYSIQDDGKTYVVELKKNVKWHDGKILNADDVLFTLQIIQDPNFYSPLRALWQGVETEKIDDYNIRFKLRNAYAPFLNNLTFGILPKHIWQNVTSQQFAHTEYNLKPVGSGPYKFEKLQKDKDGNIKTIQLSSFSDYYAGEAYIETITFKFYNDESEAVTAYKKGEIDAFNFVTARSYTEFKTKDSGGLDAHALSLPRYFAVFFNQSQNQFLADKNIRIALAYAVNKNQIISDVFMGYASPVDSPLLPGMIGYSDQIKKYDFALDHAKNLLASANWKDSDEDGYLEKDNKKLEFTLTTVNWPELTQTAEVLQAQWKNLGVKVDIETKETNQVQNDTIRPRQYQALLFGTVPGLETDLFHFWHSSQKKESGYNLALYENLQADKLLSSSIEDLDMNSRGQKNLQAVNMITEDLPAIFLFNPDYIFVSKKDIKGIGTPILENSSTRFSQIAKWYTDTHRAWK